VAIPISVFGLLFGVVGFGIGWFAGGPSLRWSLGGIAVSTVALTVSVGHEYGPVGRFAEPGGRQAAAGRAAVCSAAAGTAVVNGNYVDSHDSLEVAVSLDQAQARVRADIYLPAFLKGRACNERCTRSGVTSRRDSELRQSYGRATPAEALTLAVA